MSAKQIGVLTMIEVLVASLCIIPASHFADKYGREPFVIVTFIMFTLFPLSLLASRNFTMLAVAFAIRGLKEFGDTSRKALIISYSDAERRGQMVGAYYLVRDVIVSVAAFLGAYLWQVGPRPTPALNFLGATAFGVAGSIIYFRSTRRMREAAPPVILFSGPRRPPS
jgi:MFS family permease